MYPFVLKIINPPSSIDFKARSTLPGRMTSSSMPVRLFRLRFEEAFGHKMSMKQAALRFVFGKYISTLTGSFECAIIEKTVDSNGRQKSR